MLGQILLTVFIKHLERFDLGNLNKYTFNHLILKAGMYIFQIESNDEISRVNFIISTNNYKILKKGQRFRCPFFKFMVKFYINDIISSY